MEIVEWPGGEPKQIEADVSPATFKSLERGRTSIPLEMGNHRVEYAALPWGSIVTVRSDGETMQMISGPALYERGQRVLPVYWCSDDGEIELVP
jgi:hypothetical protein